VTALRDRERSGVATPICCTTGIVSPGGDRSTSVFKVRRRAAVCAVRPITKIIGVDLRTESHQRFTDAIHRLPTVTAEAVTTTTKCRRSGGACGCHLCCATTALAVTRLEAIRHCVRHGHQRGVGAFTPE